MFMEPNYGPAPAVPTAWKESWYVQVVVLDTALQGNLVLYLLPFFFQRNAIWL
jgi:hypothetical protein